MDKFKRSLRKEKYSSLSPALKVDKEAKEEYDKAYESGLKGKKQESKNKGEDKDMKESMKNKVYTVLKETRVGDIILEKNDRFIIVEAEGDAKDNAEDAEKAKAAGMTPKEWEKSEADKVHDKKEESTKKRKTYIVKEEVKIGNIILEKNDRFQIIESDEQKPDPDAEKYQDPVDLKLDMPDVKEEAKKDKNGKFPFEKGYIKEEDDTEEKKDDPEKKVEEDELTPDQKKLDVDKDGKIDGEDLAKIRADKKEESFITVNGKKYRAI